MKGGTERPDEIYSQFSKKTWRTYENLQARTQSRIEGEKR